jgi:hypothetical protein
MEAPALRGRSRYLRGLAIAVVVLSSVLALLPELSRNGGAAQPVFSRPNVRIDTAALAAEASMVGGPTIAVDAAGILHAVWADTLTVTDKGIFYARSLDDGTTWTGGLRIDQSPGPVNIAPSITVDATGGMHDGNIYVVWQRGETTNVESLFVESLDGGTSWVNLRTIDTAPSGSTGMYPRVAVDSAGTVYVAYMAGSVGRYSISEAMSADGGVTWSFGSILPPSVSFQGYQSIAARGGLVCVAWEESTALSDGLWISASIDKGFTWSKNSIIAFGSGMQDASWVSVAVDDSSVIHAAWVAADEMGSSSVAYSNSKDRGLTWTAPVKVSDSPSSVTYSAHSVTVLASSGPLYVVWSDNRHGDYDVYASWSADHGATWGDGVPDNDVRVDDTDENGVTLDDASFQAASSAVKDHDGVYAIWSDNRDVSTFNVYFSAFDLSDVMITEIRDSPDGMEEVEIYNAVKDNVDLTGWILEVDGMQISLSPLGLIGPNTYWTIGDPVSSGIPRDITLGDEGGIVRLLDSTGAEIDSVAYGQLGPAPDPIDGESVARVLVGASYRQAWTRAQIPTFGSMNKVLAPNSGKDLVLNEVFFSAANPDDRFIEVHLNGVRALDIGGYVIAGDAAHALPSVILTDTDREFAFRPSDAPALFNLMDASGDNLYLYDPSGALVDMVGWSSAHPQGTSMSRVPDGFGSSSGYDDASSIAAGWMFDRNPSLPFVSVGPDQIGYANPGDRVYYALYAKNKESTDAYVNVEAFPSGEGWVAALLKSGDLTPLADSPGDPDNTPDLGLLAPGASAVFLVAVNVPTIRPGNESETTRVMVSIASDPLARSTATLKTMLYPYESPTAAASPSTIWITSAPPACQPKESVMQLKVSGMGTPVYGGNVQDTIMVMDSSGSMYDSDPTDLRLEAAKHYVDLMKAPDRAAVVRFADTATLVNGDYLSSDYARVKANIDTITTSGGTDIYDAIRISTDELITYGDDNHVWIQVLLTDGVETMGHTRDMILGEAQRAASSNIKIFTIGLGNFADESLLMAIADMTGALYVKANAAEDLDQIYLMIGNVTKAIAGYDDDVTDDIPMINVYLPDFINYVPGSAIPPPGYVGEYAGMTNLQWNISQLKVAQSWTATFRITSDLEGYGERALYYPLSRVTYLRHDDLRVNVPFPVTLIDVLGVPVFPDLSVSSSDIVLSSPPPFVEGDVVSVTATIHNTGQAPSGQTMATFHDGLPPAPQIGPSQPLNQMDPGLTQDVSILWTALGPGPHTICVFADPGDLVVEESELNNIACVNVDVLPLPPTMPDYVPYLPEPRSHMKAALSATVTLSILVANVGNASASTSSTLAIGNLTGPPFAQSTLPPLPESGTSARLYATWTAPSVPGSYTVRARADYFDEVAEWDESNNEYTWTIEVVPAPITSLVVGDPHHEAARSYVTSSTPIDLSVDDRGGTGILFTDYRVDDAGWVNYTAEGRFFLHGDGAHSVDWYSADRVGNREAMESAVIVVDNTPPATTLLIGDPKYAPESCYVTSRTPLSLEAEDGGAMPVGLEGTSFRVWDGAWSQWSPFDSQFMLEGPDGVRYVEFRSTDLLGNSEAVANMTVIVDDTAPAMTLDPEDSLIAADTAFTLAADDGEGSGVRLLWISIDSGLIGPYSGPFTLQGGTHRIAYMSADNLGNTGQQERIVQVVQGDVAPVVVRFNYKPTIAFLFSLLLIGAAALSARKRTLRWCKVPWRKFLVSWALLAMPFVLAEAVTGFISVYFEPMRIPPLIGWGMVVDTLVLGVGTSVVLGRLLWLGGRKGRKPESGKT